MNEQLFLGIECGGTRTVALLADHSGSLLQRVEAGPANMRLIGPNKLKSLFTALSRQFPTPASVAVGMAGVRGEEDRQTLRSIVSAVWNGVPNHVSHDLETALWSVGPLEEDLPRVVVLSGTGSCCYGRTHEGRVAKIGGWGHILGDKGSGYEIGLRALKAVIFYLDRDDKWTRLGQSILRRLQLNDPEQLIAWVQSATKDQVAALAVEVFDAAKARDKIARDVLVGAANTLAKDAVACAKKLSKPDAAVEFVFAGSVLLKQTAFARRIRRGIVEKLPAATFQSLKRETAWGAVELARQCATGIPSVNVNERAVRATPDRPVSKSSARLPALSTTEQRNPRSKNLDRMTTSDAIDLMLGEDAKIPAAIRKEKPAIEKLINRVVRSFKSGGRLFYVGAGTSGRLGVLDASECPPTFRTSPEMVQGIIAGGREAIWSAIEGAEDDDGAGERAIEFRGIGRNDVVVGIAASGRTPFVWGAIRAAGRSGAVTALIHFNPNLKIKRTDRPSLEICPRIGPEVLTGSTRLKAGTATKLILNMITTIAMVRIGKVIGNLMVDLNPSNVKLRDRAVRIVAELTGCSYDESSAALVKCNWDLKKAVGVLSGTNTAS